MFKSLHNVLFRDKVVSLNECNILNQDTIKYIIFVFQLINQKAHKKRVWFKFNRPLSFNQSFNLNG